MEEADGGERPVEAAVAGHLAALGAAAVLGALEGRAALRAVEREDRRRLGRADRGGALQAPLLAEVVGPLACADVGLEVELDDDLARSFVRHDGHHRGNDDPVDRDTLRTSREERGADVRGDVTGEGAQRGDVGARNVRAGVEGVDEVLEDRGREVGVDRTDVVVGDLARDPRRSSRAAVPRLLLGALGRLSHGDRGDHDAGDQSKGEQVPT